MAYEKITKYAGRLAKDPGYLTEMSKVEGAWELPQYHPSPLMESFQQDFYDGSFADQNYFSAFEGASIDMAEVGGKEDLAGLDAPALLAVLTLCIRSERFGEGNLYHHAKSGILDECLELLKEIDEKAAPHS